jgi:hypothetical protein
MRCTVGVSLSSSIMPVSASSVSTWKGSPGSTVSTIGSW